MTLALDDLPEDLPELEVDVDTETLAGDVRDAMLTRYKQMPAPWSHMTQEQQNMLAEGAAYDARRLVEEAVQAVTAYEFPRAVGKIAKMVVIPKQGERPGRIECPVHFQLIPENLGVLGTEVGSMVAVIMVDSAAFKGERAPVQTDPDQPDLPLDAAPPEDQDDALDAPIVTDPPPELLGLPSPEREVEEAELVDVTPPEVDEAAEIQEDADGFEASLEELNAQITRGKLQAEREGGTTEPKPRRSRKAA